MKIVCGACSAKYSVADEKLGGRSVKIRCKKCGGAIQVAAPVIEGAWHVLVGDAQRGPMSPAQIGALIAEGAIGWDAYVWREGLADWCAAEELKELVDAIMGTAPASNDLFATESASVFAGSDDVVASSPPPRIETMTGARNESSVLFSLANLSALGAPSTERKATEAARGMASGEGSGLIDIRALASATGLTSPTSTSPRSAASKDDLLELGAPSLALGPSLAAPIVIAPTREPRRTGSAMVIAAAFLAVGLIGGASALALVRVAPSTPPMPIEPARVEVATPIETPTPTPTPTTSPTPTPTPTTSPTTSPPPVAERRPRAPRAPVVEREVVVTETPRAPARERSFEDLIEQAGNRPHDAPRPRIEPVPSGPTTPAREDVMRAMNAVRDAVTACGGGEHGLATVRVSFASSGRVSSAVVEGSFAGTPVGSCVARAVRGASVPPFTQSSFSLSYPFRI